MNRDLEDELLNCPIGNLGDEDAQQAHGAAEVPNAASLANERPPVPLHTNLNVPPPMPHPLTSNFLSPTPLRHPHALLNETVPGRPALPSLPATFMEQVLRILDDAQKYNFEHIVSWQPDNNSFKVHRIHDFETKILPSYLDQTRVRSFQRQ